MVFYLGENLFLAQFTDKGDKDPVFCHSLWLFDKSLVLLRKYDGKMQPSNISIFFASFWVRIYDLPLNGMNGKTIRVLGIPWVQLRILIFLLSLLVGVFSQEFVLE